MCMETAQAGEQEVEELGEILSNTRSEYKALQMRNAELLRVHNELTQQLRRNVRYCDAWYVCVNI